MRIASLRAERSRYARSAQAGTRGALAQDPEFARPDESGSSAFSDSNAFERITPTLCRAGEHRDRKRCGSEPQRRP